MQRPVGVTIVAIIAILYGIFSLLLALLGLLGLALLASGVGKIQYSAGTLAYATIWNAPLGILFLAFGIGAFSLKGWAWTAGVIALALDVIRQIVDFVLHGFSASNLVSPIITVVIALVLLVYLFLPNVRAAFGFRRGA